jgi:hypothetical protein
MHALQVADYLKICARKPRLADLSLTKVNRLLDLILHGPGQRRRQRPTALVPTDPGDSRPAFMNLYGTELRDLFVRIADKVGQRWKVGKSH